jgi:hypothetical protein
VTALEQRPAHAVDPEESADALLRRRDTREAQGGCAHTIRRLERRDRVRDLAAPRVGPPAGRCHGRRGCPVLLGMTHNTQPTAAGMLAETASLLCFVAFYGPPVLFFLIPWLALGLMLMGPFTVIITLLAALLAAFVLVAGLGALLVMPIMMLRGRRTPSGALRTSAVRMQAPPVRVAA